MKKRIMSVLLSLALLLGAVTATGLTGTVLAGRSTTVLCVGDSITFGYASRADGSGYQVSNPYPKVLGNLLGAGYDVRNKGISGTSVVDGDGRTSWLSYARTHAEESWLQAADVALVMLGTNDICTNWAQRAGRFKTEYQALLDALREQNPQVQIYILTTPYTDRTDCEAYLPAVTELERELANENGCTLIDLYTVTKTYYDTYGREAYFGGCDIELNVLLHPGEPVLAAMAKAVYTALAPEAASYPYAPVYLTGAADGAYLEGVDLAAAALAEKTYVNATPVFRNVYTPAPYAGWNGNPTDARWVRTTYDAATCARLTDGQLSGVTGGGGESYISVNATNHDRTAADKPYQYAMARIVVVLGDRVALERVLLGNMNTETVTRMLWKGTLSVADSMDELFTADTILGSWSCLEDPEAFPRSSAVRGVVFALHGQVSGRYVAIEVPADAGSGYKVFLDELGIYAYEPEPVYLTGDSDVKWLMNDAYTKDNQQLSAGKNRMAGRWTTNTDNANGVTVLSNVYSYYNWSYNGQPANSWQNVRSSPEVYGSAEVLSDGRLYGVGDGMPVNWSCGWLEVGGTNHNRAATASTGEYEMIKLIFDLGESTAIGRILFGDNVASGTTQTPLVDRLWQGQLFVGDDFGDDLFTENHRQGSWSYLTEAQQASGALSKTETTDKKGVVFDFAAPATGRYVGILVPAAGTGNGYQVRLGEVGIYAYENTVHFLSDETDAHWLNSSGRNLVTAMLADENGTVKADGNWIPDRIHTAGATTEAHIRTAATRSCLVDGKIYGINSDTVEQAVIQLGVQGNAGGTDGWRYPLGQLTFDLGESTAIGRIVVGFPAEDTAGNNPSVGVIYVADTEEELFTAEAVQATWSYLTNNGNNWGNIQAVTDKGVALDLPEGITGRYVGFKISEAGNVGYGVNLSEVGIYTKVPASAVAEPDVPELSQPTVTQLTAQNAALIPAENQLAAATVVTGTVSAPEQGVDGVINGINGNTVNKMSVRTENETVMNPLTGAIIRNASGWGCVGYKLATQTSIEQLLVAGSADDAVHPDGITNKYVLYYEIYISDQPDDLFQSSRRVFAFDNASADPTAAGLAQLITLPTAVSGRYVGFRVTGGEYKTARIGELGVYGVPGAPDPAEDVQITQLHGGEDADKIPDRNLLSVLSELTVGTAKQTPERAYDGIVSGIHTQEDNKAVFAVDTDTALHPETGEPLTHASGWARIGYKLYNTATIRQFLVAGSAKDSVNPNGITNKYVLYYEIYVSDSAETLFASDHRVCGYDNSAQNPGAAGLTQLVTLRQPVEGQYVGFRVTGGEYGLARIGEFGVYGDMEAPALLTAEPLVDEAAYTQRITGKTNLLKGEAVANKKHDYLEPRDISIVSGEAAYLTDDYINWTAQQEEKKVTYSTRATPQLWYDLRGTAALEGLLVANSGADAQRHRLTSLRLYVSEELETLFDEQNQAGSVNFPVGIAFYVPLQTLAAQGRYVGLLIAGDSEYGVARLTELGLYGSYTQQPSAVPDSLLTGAGAARTDAYTISARGIDNCTAGADNGNTGALSGVRNFSVSENLNGLTNGDTNDRVYAHILQENASIHVYDLQPESPWVVFAYYLGGSATLESISLTSAPEMTKLYTTGVQYYASETYSDLFKSESLLYTSGGENRIVDPETGKEKLDPSTEIWRQRTISYMLTPAQRAKTYKFIACVITRPYSLYGAPDENGVYEYPFNGHGVTRLSELDVQGTLDGSDQPLVTSYTAVSATLGTVQASIRPTKQDYDHPEFFYAIDHMEVTEESLPTGISPHVDNYWMSVDGDRVYHIRFYDSQGQQLDDPEGHDLELTFAAQAAYPQFVGVVETDGIRRLMNAATLQDGQIHAGMNAYPQYGDEQPNNRALATLQGLEHRLVLLKYNDLATISELSGSAYRLSIAEFESSRVAGTATAVETKAYRPAIVAAALLLAGAMGGGCVLLHRKKRHRLRKGGVQ